MKLLKKSLAVLVVVMSGLISCLSAMAGQPETGPVYSNIVESKTIDAFYSLLLRCGVGQESANNIRNSIVDYNDTVGTELLTDRGTLDPVSPLPSYDVTRMDDRWLQHHGAFIGYNCRITAFEVMKGFISVDTSSCDTSSTLLMDDEALGTSDGSYFDANERIAFMGLFSTIPTTPSLDAEEHIRAQKAYWDSIGVRFAEGKLSLITVYLHNHFSDDENELIIGHAGVLFDVEDGYVFFEKLSFQLPYQLIHFQSKDELRQYLMTMYDTDTTGECAKPFILQNDHLL